MSKTQKQPLVVKPTVAESPKKDSPKVESPKVESPEIVAETWKLVQDIATSEIEVNGRMLFLFKNMIEMYDENLLDIALYFDKTANDKSEMSLFYGADAKRKTFIPSHYDRFVNLVIIPALNQNLLDFRKNNEYEYKALQAVCPAVLFGISERDNFEIDTMLSNPTNPKIPVELKLIWDIFKFGKDVEESAFRKNLANKFLTEKQHSKDYWATFRGDFGIYEISRSYFQPLKVNDENASNSKKSDFSKALEKLNDVEKGVVGTRQSLTQGKGEIPNNRRENEVKEIKTMLFSFINLLSKTDSPKAQHTLLEIYEYLVVTMKTENFRKNLPIIVSKNVEFDPKIKDRTFEINKDSNLIKYITNV